jgi:soluble lytic murein transglycosylase-like protein
MFRVDRKALWSGRGLAMVGLTLLFGLLVLSFGEWSRPPKYIPRDQVWAVVEREAAKHGLDPRFVFAIVAAESSFNARARNGDARGLMQIRPIAWREVAQGPHRHAWRWKTNIEVGTAYLGHLKTFLHENGQFSYPMLAACYRHGPYRVKATGFRLEELPAPRNEIYRELHRGNLAPVKVSPSQG